MRPWLRAVHHLFPTTTLSSHFLPVWCWSSSFRYQCIGSHPSLCHDRHCQVRGPRVLLVHAPAELGFKHLRQPGIILSMMITVILLPPRAASQCLLLRQPALPGLSSSMCSPPHLIFPLLLMAVLRILAQRGRAAWTLLLGRRGVGALTACGGGTPILLVRRGHVSRRRQRANFPAPTWIRGFSGCVFRSPALMTPG